MNSIEYDPIVDAVYFQFTDGLGIESEEIAEGIIVDYDQSDNVIAVELLGVKTLSPENFQKLKPLLPASALAHLQGWLPQRAIA